MGSEFLNLAAKYLKDRRPDKLEFNKETHIGVTGSGAKKIKIQNKAELTRNSAPMLASFLVNSALFCIFIFFPPEPVTPMCVAVLERK